MATDMLINNLGDPIALGRTAEIYAWQPGWIVKLFFDWFRPEDIAYEHRIASAIHTTGLPVPAVGEIVHISGRTGLIYQRCDGESMAVDLTKHPAHMFVSARKLAELQAEMHARHMQVDIPLLHHRLERKIRNATPLSENLRSTALKALKTMPEGDCLCHGDFHPGNVLLSQSGPIIIDWIDSSVGNPLADVARTSILALGMAARSPTNFARFYIRSLHSIYLQRYFRLRPGGREEYRRWLPIVAAARLDEGIAELEAWLLAQAGAAT